MMKIFDGSHAVTQFKEYLPRQAAGGGAARAEVPYGAVFNAHDALIGCPRARPDEG